MPVTELFGNGTVLGQNIFGCVLSRKTDVSISTATGMHYAQIISQSYYMTNPGIGLAPNLPFFAKVRLQPTT